MPMAATKLLLKQSSSPINLAAVIPYELGGAATASALATAAWLDIPIIDADFVGRAVPEATQMLPAIHGFDLCPTAGSDAYGNETLICKTVNRHMTERIGKFIASASFGLIGQATLLRQAKTLKPFMLQRTLSNAAYVGKLLRNSKEKRSNLISELAEVIGSRPLIEGVVSNFNGYEKDGYYVGEIFIDGVNDYKNMQLKIWFKNENHIAWLNDNVKVTSPELISIVDRISGLPYINNQLKSGLNVIVFETPAHPEWHKGKALEAQTPRYYGFDIDVKLLK